jgi:hypothetical protein
MSKISRLAVLVVGLVSLFGILSASAGAVTWHNMGSTTFTATAGAGTLSSTGASLGCVTATGTGTAPVLTVGNVYNVSGTATFNNCVLSGIATGVDCAYTLTGNNLDGGNVMGSVVTGSVDVTCGVYQFGTKICHISGSTGGTYTNNVPGVLTIAASSSLITSNGPTGSCPLGNGDAGALTHLTFTTTSANPPTLTRTP